MQRMQTRHVRICALIDEVSKAFSLVHDYECGPLVATGGGEGWFGSLVGAALSQLWDQPWLNALKYSVHFELLMVRANIKEELQNGLQFASLCALAVSP